MFILQVKAMVNTTMQQMDGLIAVHRAVTADRLWYGLLMSEPKIKELITWLARTALVWRARL